MTLDELSTLRLLYGAAATIRGRFDKAELDSDGEQRVWEILGREDGSSTSVEAIEAARAEAHQATEREVDEVYGVSDEEEELEPDARDATEEAWDREYRDTLGARGAEVDAIYDAARDILLYLTSLPPDHPWHSDLEAVCTLVDEYASVAKIDETWGYGLAYIDAAIAVRSTLDASVAGIVADAKRRRARARRAAHEPAPSRTAEAEADDLEASSAQEKILELLTEGA